MFKRYLDESPGIPAQDVVVDISPLNNSSAERLGYPTQKPVDLGRYLVRTFSNEGDVILDNAFGSGSFLVAAALEKRRFIGIERNEEVHLFKNDRIDYVEIATQRLIRCGADPSVFRR